MTGLESVIDGKRKSALSRRLEGLCAEALKSAESDVGKLRAKLVNNGTFGHGHRPIWENEAIIEVYRRAIPDAAVSLLQAAGCDSGVAIELLRPHAMQLAADMAERQANRLKNLNERLYAGRPFVAELREQLAKWRLEAEDSLTLGVHGVRKANEVDTVAAVVLNSPGAVVQAGRGNIQHATSVATGRDLRLAVDQLMQSEAVQALPKDDETALINFADAVNQNADAEPAKQAWWAKKLYDLAEQTGVATAATLLAAWLGALPR